MNVLQGSKAIADFVGRSWKIVFRLIQEEDFPAVKIAGRWESDADLIKEWRKARIQKNRPN